MKQADKIILQKVIEIFHLCVCLKQVGVDAFFNWMPHVNEIAFFIFENGWTKGGECKKRVSIYLDNAPPDRVVQQLNEALDYLLARLAKHSKTDGRNEECKQSGQTVTVTVSPVRCRRKSATAAVHGCGRKAGICRVRGRG